MAETILGSVNTTHCDDPRADLLNAAGRYPCLRVDWALTLTDPRDDVGRRRTMAHDVRIDLFSILGRALAQNGGTNAWRAASGSDRRVIGDIAYQPRRRERGGVFTGSLDTTVWAFNAANRDTELLLRSILSIQSDAMATHPIVGIGWPARPAPPSAEK